MRTNNRSKPHASQTVKRLRQPAAPAAFLTVADEFENRNDHANTFRNMLVEDSVSMGEYQGMLEDEGVSLNEF